MKDDILKELKKEEESLSNEGFREDVFLKEGETRSYKPIAMVLFIFSFFLILFSLFFIFQWWSLNKKIKQNEEKYSQALSSFEKLSEEKNNLEKEKEELKLKLEESLTREGKALEWEDFNNLGLEFSYPKKWGRLTLTAQKNNIFEFQTENPEVDIVYYFKESNVLVFLNRELEHYNICSSSIPYYDKTVKIILPEKKIIPVFYITPPAYIACSQLYNSFPMGMVNANLSPDAKYLYFLVHGKDWSVPKLINLETKENILEKTGQQFWFDPWEDVYWLEGNRLAITSFALFPKSPEQASYAPNEIAIYLSEPNQPENLQKIYSVKTEDNPNLFFGNLEIRENKLFFFLFQGSVNPITRKRIILTREQFVYDLSSKKVEKIK